MTIKKITDGDKLIISLEGRLDTNTSMELDKQLKSSMEGISSIEFDLRDLVYVSSSGIRLLLGVYKAVGGNIKIINVQDAVMEVFETTGFAAAFKIE